MNDQAEAGRLRTERARALAARRMGAAASAEDAALGLADAYRLQFAVEDVLCAEHGFRPTGWKIGATNAGARAAFATDEPFLGRLYAQMTQATPARIAFRPGFHRAYEAEIALEIGRDLDGRDGPYDAAALRAATRAVAPAIEIVGSHVAPGGAAGVAGVIADLAGHGAWIVGPWRTDFAGLDLIEAPVTLTVNGERRAAGKGANVDGGPFGSAAWLANALVKLGRGLKAGDYVTTGTVIAPSPMGPGETAVADFGPLGRVEATTA